MFRRMLLGAACLTVAMPAIVVQANASTAIAMLQIDAAALATEILDALAAMSETASQEEIIAEINRVLAQSGATADEALQALDLAQASLVEGSAAWLAVEAVRAQIQSTGFVQTGAGGDGGDSPVPPPPGGGRTGGGSDYETGN